MEKKHQIIRFIVYALLLLPLMIQRDVTPDNELRYLSIADESISDGHFFTMYNHGEPYADKPPLYFWIIMGVKTLLGHHSPFLITLIFSLIPAFVILSIFNRWCKDELSEKWRIASELALLTSVYFLGGSIFLRMDMLMCMFITLAMYTFYRMYEGDTSLKLRIAFPIYIFMAIFSKGPVGIMVPLFCIPVFLIVKREFKTIGRYWGWMTWLVLAILCGIWWTFVYLEGGTEYINNLLFHQTMGRAVNSFAHHKSFFFYFYSIWYSAAPWVFLTVGVVIWALIKKRIISPLAEFMLITVATIFVMMTIVSSKLQIYLLPSYGFMTYGAFLILAKNGKTQWQNLVINVSASLLLVIFIAGFFTQRFNSRIGYHDIAIEAATAAQQADIHRFGYCNLKGGENLDVFLGQELEEISPEQLQNPDKLISETTGIIVFTKRENSVIFYTFAGQNNQECNQHYQVLN